jgi:hypothetical protein
LLCPKTPILAQIESAQHLKPKNAYSKQSLRAAHLYENIKNNCFNKRHSIMPHIIKNHSWLSKVAQMAHNRPIWSHWPVSPSANFAKPKTGSIKPQKVL